ncbi:MAG: hypothetical protein LBJ20_01700 [Candidatus Methanoplasma sp.]|jgi:hypothetical protein|nr:hypothetical protein [Candidatus Methanoplasma sp.]
MAESKQTYAPMPDVVKDSVLADDYQTAIFTEETLEDVMDELAFFKKNHKEIIARYEKIGGRMERGIDSTGETVQGSYWFTLGQITLVTEWKGAKLTYHAIHTDHTAKKASQVDELDIILQAFYAYRFRDSPDEVAPLIEKKIDNLWSVHQIKGIHTMGKRIREDTILTASAVSGAQVEKILPDRLEIAGDPELDGGKKQTEYRRGE